MASTMPWQRLASNAMNRADAVLTLIKRARPIDAPTVGRYLVALTETGTSDSRAPSR